MLEDHYSLHLLGWISCKCILPKWPIISKEWDQVYWWDCQSLSCSGCRKMLCLLCIQFDLEIMLFCFLRAEFLFLLFFIDSIGWLLIWLKPQFHEVWLYIWIFHDIIACSVFLSTDIFIAYASFTAWSYSLLVYVFVYLVLNNIFTLFS